jgi:cell division transport system permease protein
VTHALREAITAFRRAPVLTGLSAAMVGLALFVVALFALAAFNLRIALQAVEERVEIVAYLAEGTSTPEIEVASSELARLPEVAAVRHITKDEALVRAQRDLPEFGELFGSTEVNPLPESLEVELRDGVRTEEVVAQVAGIARAYPFVEDVAYGREWVDKLFALRRIAGVTTAVLGAAFGTVAALIIGTALRIAIFARKDEIYVMRLVGARNSFVRRPFLVEGAIAGLLGGALALLLTWATYRAVVGFLFGITWMPGSWAAAVVGAGAAFGILASAIAVRRHLSEV